MPTHVEIGRIPPTPSSLDGSFSNETLPRTHRKAMKKDDSSSRGVCVCVCVCAWMKYWSCCGLVCEGGRGRG